MEKNGDENSQEKGREYLRKGERQRSWMRKKIKDWQRRNKGTDGDIQNETENVGWGKIRDREQKR